MKLSPLQLKQHCFTLISVKAVPGGEATGEPVMEPTIWFEPEAGQANQWKLALSLKLTSANPAKPFCYEAEIHIQGIVEVVGSLPEDRKEDLAVVNGLSILYSAVREMLLNLTARSANGAMSLPTLSFVDMVAAGRQRRLADAKATTPLPA